MFETVLSETVFGPFPKLQGIDQDKGRYNHTWHRICNPLAPPDQKDPQQQDLQDARIVSEVLRWQFPLASRSVVTPLARQWIGSVPTTPDPDTSARASRYKWEPYRDTIGGVYTTFCQEEGMFLQKYRDRNGGVSRYFSKVPGSGIDFILLNEDDSCTSWKASFRTMSQSIAGTQCAKESYNCNH